MILENSSSGGGNEWSAWFTKISRVEVISMRFKYLRYDRNPVGILSDCNFRARFLSYLMNKRAANDIYTYLFQKEVVDDVGRMHPL
jgi:hypothetical protein